MVSQRLEPFFIQIFADFNILTLLFLALGLLRSWCNDWSAEQKADSWIGDIVSEEQEFEEIFFLEKTIEQETVQQEREETEKIAPKRADFTIISEDDVFVSEETSPLDVNDSQNLPADITKICKQRGQLHKFG